MNTKYSAVEKKYIRDRAGKWTDAKLLRKFNRKFNRNLSLNCFRKLRLRMGIEKAMGRGKNEVLKYSGPPIPKKPRNIKVPEVISQEEQDRRDEEELDKKFGEIPRKDMSLEDLMARRWQLKAKKLLRHSIHLK